MRKLALALSSILLVSASFAQSIPPPAPPVAGSLDTSEPAPPPRYEDNVRPLGGVQNYDLGNRTDLFNLLTPTFDFSQSYGTNPGLQTVKGGETVWGATTSVGGSLQLMRTSTSQQFSMTYRGAAQLNSYNSALNTQVHALSLSESLGVGRWHYVFGNDLSYEPNAFGATLPFLFPGMDGTGFRPGLGPDSTILTPQNTRLSETPMAQVSYGLSRSSVVTGNVSYGILHYTNDGFLDTRQLTSTGSYNHSFGHNTVGVAYTYSKFMYANADEDFNTQALEFSYARRIIGRVSIELGAGPTFTNIHVGPISFLNTTANGKANIKYAGNKTDLNFGYTRAVTAGSGITPGTITDDISGSIHRKLSHTFSINGSVRYVLNSGTAAPTNFNSSLFAADITRDVGRYLSMSIGYNGQGQTGNVSTANIASHAAVVSLRWRFRPVRLQ